MTSLGVRTPQDGGTEDPWASARMLRSHTWVTSGANRNRNFTSSMSTLTGSKSTVGDSSLSSVSRSLSRSRTYLSHGDLGGYRGDLGPHPPGLGGRSHTRSLLSCYRGCSDYGYHDYHHQARAQTAPETMIAILEDGRTPVLPPLGASGNHLDGRFRRQTTTGLGATSLVMDDMALPRAVFKPRRVSVAVDRKVVNHLRKQLNRRLERRVALLMEEELDEQGVQLYHSEPEEWQDTDDDGRTLHPTEASFRPRRRSTRRKPTNVSLDDLTQSEAHAELRQKLDTMETAESPSQSLPLIGGAQEEVKVISTLPPPPVEGATDNTDGVQVAPPGVGHLPDIGNEAMVTRTGGGLVKDTELSSEESEEDATPNEETLSDNMVDQELEDVLSKDVMSEPEVTISPVPTPYMFRPETRDHNRLTVEEKVKGILGGNVMTSFVPDKRTVTIFISGHCTDSDGERSVLIERTLPALHNWVAGKGYTLNVVDPHWGLRDLTTDDHSGQGLVTDLIEQAQDSTKRGINFVTFLGQKYGDPLLPVTIDKAEFEVIRTAMEEDYNREVQAAAAAAAAAEESKRREEEAKKQQQEKAKKMEVLRRMQNVEEEEEGEEEEEEEGEYDTDEEEAELGGTTSSLNRDNALKATSSGVTRDRSVSFDSAVKTGNSENQMKTKRRLSVALREARPNRMDKLRKTAKNTGKEVMTSRFFQREVSSVKEGPGELVDPALLKSWYRLDTNTIPALYRLQNISSHYKDFARNDANKRQGARQQWVQVSTRLQRMLSTYATRLLEEHAARKYSTSLLEVELQHGLLWSSQDPRDHAFWFRRDIEDLDNHLSDVTSRDYADVQPMTGHVEPSLKRALTELKDGQMEKALPKERVWKYPVNWNAKGVSLSSTRSHAIYLDRMSHEFYNVVTASMREAFSCDVTRPDMTSDLFQEVVQHVNLCQERSRTFHGRKQLLQTLKTYIRCDGSCPLVVYGGTGCGKTALLAKAARDCAKWTKGTTPAIVFRSVGVTPSSTNLRLMLRDICRQLTEVYGVGTDQSPNDHKGLVNDFNFRLTMATPERPLVVFIDGVSLLSDDNDAHKMGWLPKELPPNVKLVVSTLKDGECFPALERSFPDSPETFLEVPELPVPDAVTILEHWFRAERREVTKEQFDVMIDIFRSCPMPLYLRLIYLEGLRWLSYQPASEIKLANTVKKLAVTLFGRLEKDHGEPLVRRALGYLTASRNGVTESEIQDLLSLDDAVLDDIFAHTKPTLRRIPPLCWLRLKRDMENYVIQTLTDDTVTLRWFHYQFHEAATERYLNQRDKAPSYHKSMAEYFMDTWSAKPKPSPKGGAMLRHVTPQPLLREPNKGDDTLPQKVYNIRRLTELPFHLLNSQQNDVLKKECLCNYAFLLAKLSATSLRAIFDDLQMTLLVEPADASLRMLVDTLSLSANVLNADPSQLASQLVGRLHRIVTLDVPVAPADPVKYPYLKPLFKQILKSSTPALIPSSTCLTPPGGILFDLLYGHTEPITAVVSTADGQRAMTASRDNTLKLWELRSGRVTRTIQGVGANVFSIRLGAGNSIVVTSEVDRIRVWSMKSGTLMRDIDQYDDPANITIATEANLMAAFFDGCRKLRVFNLNQDNVPLTKEVDLSDEDNIHKDNSSLVSLNTHGVQVLYAFRSGSFAHVRNIKSGKRIHKFKFTGSATAVATSREYFLVAVRKQYMKLHEIAQLELFDLRNGQAVRTVRGCTNDNIRELHINQLGSHALVISSSEANNTSDIAVWNIETEDHKHLAKHANVSHFGTCVDVRYCLTASPNENCLRIWNLSSKMNQPAPKAKQPEGLEKLLTIDGHPRYIIAKSLLNGPLNVWNMSKKRYAGMIVRSMSGILDMNDVMIVKGTKLVILTEKGFSNVTATTRPVFQTILTYDLLEGKFINKITGCYIVPSQPHEYVILNDNTLLGLSDTRNHFVVWSLATGHVSYRIKPSFKNVAGSDSEDEDYGIRKRKDSPVKRRRNTTAKMAPWDRRAETQTARHRRHAAEIEEEKNRLVNLKKEKENAIEQFLISKDQSTIVASYYGHHLCVFNVTERCHNITLENENSMLLLHVAALTDNGSHLVLANYDDETKTSYLTLWNCKDGMVKRRLRNEKNVCCIAISDGAEKIVFGKTNKELRIWDPSRAGSVNRIKGYAELDFKVGSQIHMLSGGQRVVVYAGDISVWDLARGVLLTVFTPDMTIQGFTVAMDGQMMAFGLRDRNDVITLRLIGTGNEEENVIVTRGQNLFGEVSDSSSEEDDDENENEDSEEDDRY